VGRLEREGRTKKVRERARECKEDERLSNWGAGEEQGDGDKKVGDGEKVQEEDDEEWKGFDD